ncbi:hypothetical protein [Streptomyces sp. NPDC088115]|uniref:hypothetical protein n=1 Tax=Streptomyces sp. NPDC088115 TaxID=3365824 RepID=UPI00381B037B
MRPEVARSGVSARFVGALGVLGAGVPAAVSAWCWTTGSAGPGVEAVRAAGGTALASAANGVAVEGSSLIGAPRGARLAARCTGGAGRDPDASCTGAVESGPGASGVARSPVA